VRAVPAYDGHVTEVKTAEAPACDAVRDLLPASDLHWLLHRAAQRFREAMDGAVRRHGVGSMRAYLVLVALIREPGRAQLTLGAALGLDKTTLTAVLDRLERQGLIIRRPDPADRRVRIPEITEAGRRVQAEIAPSVQAAEAELVGMLSGPERNMLRAALGRLAAGPTAPAGSCI
jgi:MarR family transcriptional regulator, organic hydroperoxide resistance regulator